MNSIPESVVSHFVLTRNGVLDWRALVAPSQIIAAGADYDLVLLVSEQHPISLSCKKWHAGGEDWQVWYRSFAAHADITGGSETEALRDQFGREIYVVEGVLSRPEAPLNNDSVTAVLDEMHAETVDAVRRFWPQEDEEWRPTPSLALSVASGDRAASRSSRENAIRAGALVFGSLVVSFLLWRWKRQS